MPEPDLMEHIAEIRAHGPAKIHASPFRNHEELRDVLGTIQVKTPDRSMDVMLNRWMLYQTLACRVWARAAPRAIAANAVAASARVQSSRSAGTLPPFSASLRMTCLCSHIFMAAESSVLPV